MSRYRKIDTRIWNDKKFNSLTDDAKLVFMYFLSHQHLTYIGAMRATAPGLACEMRWDAGRFKLAFDQITSLNMAKYDESCSFLWLPNFIKYNRPESPNVVKSWDQLLDYLPECDLKDELIASVRAFVKTMTAAFSEALPKAFLKGMPYQEQEQDQEQEQEQEKETTRGQAGAVSENSLSSEEINNHKQNEGRTRAAAIEVLEFLNGYANKSYEPTAEHLEFIMERINEGNTIDICRALIVRKTNQWKDGGDSFKANINPITLFRKKNFYFYKGELVLPKESITNESK